jgi:hypothetical protein
MEQASFIACVRIAEDCLASDDFSDEKLPKAGEMWGFFAKAQRHRAS